MSFRYTDIFKADPNFLANEEKYAEIKREILGDSDDEDEDEESGSDVSSDGEEDGDVGESASIRRRREEKFTERPLQSAAPNKEGITDMTETNLINLRRTIYLTIMNSLGFEEATHKLLKVQVPEGHEVITPRSTALYRHSLTLLPRGYRSSFAIWSSSVAPKNELTPPSTASSESVSVRSTVCGPTTSKKRFKNTTIQFIDTRPTNFVTSLGSLAIFSLPMVSRGLCCTSST